MNKIATFEKVSYNNFKEAMMDALKIKEEDASKKEVEENIRNTYDNIVLPHTATKGSAGHDFHSTLNFILKPGETIKIPTGIRCKIDEGWVLLIFPRSGLGFKYRLQLNNTIGVIDQDYYYSDNEGHIFVKLTNDSNEEKVLEIKKGDAFCQGLFFHYGVAEVSEETRNGGGGSTDNIVSNEITNNK